MQISVKHFVKWGKGGATTVPNMWHRQKIEISFRIIRFDNLREANEAFSHRVLRNFTFSSPITDIIEHTRKWECSRDFLLYILWRYCMWIFWILSMPISKPVGTTVWSRHHHFQFSKIHNDIKAFCVKTKLRRENTIFT